MPVTLYKTDAVEDFHVAATTTDAAGDYQFTLTDTSAGQHTYVVRYPGDAVYETSVSAEIVVTYVTIPTTITAKVAPRHQFVGRDVTITGTLTADGTPVSEASVTLSNADDSKGVSVATTATDAAGYYQFTLSNTSAGQHAYVVRYPGDAVYETSVSAEKVATYVTTPTTITVTASPQKQVVGRDVIISGRRLTPDGGRVAATPLTLYKTDATETVPVATTTTDDYGYYQFTSIDTVATTHVYTVCAEADSTYSSAQSTELLVTYTSLPTVAAAKVRLALNLAWFEILSILLIIAGEGLFFAGYRIADVGVQALNIVAVAVIVVGLHGQRVKLVEVLALVSVFRVVNLSFALVPTTTLYWLIAIYGVMYVPIVALIVHCKMSRSDLGRTGGVRLAYLIPVGALIGTAFGLVEYEILANSALVPSLSLLSLIELSIVMIFFVGFVEGLLFQSLLLQSFVERSGAVVGILITSIIFAMMHAGYANGYELLFAFGAGLVLGVAFYKTKNLPFVVTIYAVNNIILFGVLPFFVSRVTLNAPPLDVLLEHEDGASSELFALSAHLADRGDASRASAAKTKALRLRASLSTFDVPFPQMSVLCGALRSTGAPFRYANNAFRTSCAFSLVVSTSTRATAKSIAVPGPWLVMIVPCRTTRSSSTRCAPGISIPG